MKPLFALFAALTAWGAILWNKIPPTQSKGGRYSHGSSQRTADYRLNRPRGFATRHLAGWRSRHRDMERRWWLSLLAAKGARFVPSSGL